MTTSRHLAIGFFRQIFYLAVIECYELAAVCKSFRADLLEILAVYYIKKLLISLECLGSDLIDLISFVIICESIRDHEIISLHTIPDTGKELLILGFNSRNLGSLLGSDLEFHEQIGRNLSPVLVFDGLHRAFDRFLCCCGINGRRHDECACHYECHCFLSDVSHINTPCFYIFTCLTLLFRQGNL